MIKVIGRVLKPEDAEIEINIRMSLKNWKSSLEQMDETKYPSWELGNEIRQVIDKVEKTSLNDKFYE
jgi:hypothetical protein